MGILIITIVLLVLAAKVVARVLTNKKIANIVECVLWWMTVSVVFPFRAKSLGIIHKKIYSWLLILISPAAIITYIAVYVIVTFNTPLPYDKLLFTSREEIAAITEIEDFPEFEYINNDRDDWDGITWTRNKFKNEDDSKLLIEKIERKLSEEENYLWYKDDLIESEKEFFGGDGVYVLDRGWLDTSYMECPKGIKEKWTQVRIAIGEKAFVVRNAGCFPWDLGYYSNPDSLSKLTEVKIPDYKFVNFRYSVVGPDSGWSALMELEKKPSKAFLQSIGKSEKWKKLDDGRYEFYSEDRKGHLWEYLYVDPKSKFVKLIVDAH